MEKNGNIHHNHEQQQPSSFSGLLDNTDRPSKSLWLQITLAELDGKIKKILEVVEDDGDTFVKRAEMFYQKRPELIKMVVDLQKSYRALADKYDLIMLRSESLRAFNSCRSTSNSFRQVCLVNHSFNNLGHILIDPHDHSTSECDHHLSYNSYDDQELTKQQNPNLTSNSSCVPTNTAEKNEIYGVNYKSEDTVECGHDMEKVEEEDAGAGSLDDDHHQRQGWDEVLVEVSKMIEENTSKQTELIRRYNAKKDDMKQLVKENRRLRDLLAQRNMIDVNKQSSSQTNTNSKWKASNLLFRKLFR